MTDVASLPSAKTPRRDAVIAALRALQPELKARGVEHLYLFGSVARDEAKPGSDVDLFFDDAPERLLGLLKFIQVKHFLEDRTGYSVDFGPRDSLHRICRASIEKSALRVF